MASIRSGTALHFIGAYAMTTTASAFPLRLPVKTVPGTWTFANHSELVKHTESFPHTAMRHVVTAHSSEYEVYAVMGDSRVLVAVVDPLAITEGIQLFTPAGHSVH